MARNERNQVVGKRYLRVFGVLILFDVSLFVLHAILFAHAWASRSRDTLQRRDELVSTHFVSRGGKQN